MRHRVALLLGKCCLIGAIAAVPFAFSMWVDPARIRGTPAAEREIAQALLNGHYVTNVANYRDRAIERLLAGSREVQPHVLVIGSSRGQSIPPEAFPGSSFVNASLTDGRLDDLIGTYGLYASPGRRSKRLVVVLDPWTLTRSPQREAWGPLSASHEYMLRQMGDSSSQVMTRARLLVNAFRRMAAPEYFRLSVFSFRRYGPKGIRYEVTERPQNAEKTRAPEGNVIWTPLSVDDANSLAAEYSRQVRAHIAFYNGETDTSRIGQLGTFLKTIRRSGVDVSILLVPFHPLAWDALQQTSGGGLTTMESSYRALAARVGVSIVGGYDPAQFGVTAADMFDESHMRPEALVRLLRK